jgi:hypothetical protein
MIKQLFLFSACLSFIFASSQETYLRTSLKKSHDSIPFPNQILLEVDKGDLKEAFKLLSKDLSKASKDKLTVNQRLGLISATNTNWKILPFPGMIHIKTLIKEGAGGVTILMSFQDTALRPVNLESGQMFYQLDKYLRKTGNSLFLSHLRGELKREKKVLDGFTKDVASEQKKTKRSEKSILGFQNKIESLKQDIEVRQTAQAGVLEEIKGVDRRISGTNPVDVDQIKAANKEKSRFEKQQKKNRKDIDRYRKQIFDLEKRIESEKGAIDQNKVAENSASQMVQKQQEKIDNLLLQIQETQSFLRAK